MMSLQGSGAPAAELVLAGGSSGSGAASPFPFPVVVEVRGVTGPAQFSKLPDALAALLGSLRALPLDVEQRKYFDELFGPDAVQGIGHRLAMYGQVRALAFVGLTPHVVKLYPVEPGASS
ncbi:hypothetical protein F7Q99_07835 [Streptomyces kaniharaensis]|uniref:Uncharacterized protein n=1 Tax=Streptomyces kaniharaensis TaxID=212423 RepID=A0A6N7KL58_9ACTN|nr:hypothetical protein [Streptomyces kaniharaensis]MQS12206.1 hypothetical protein [Streptomyces kaniharaensis]